MKLITGQGTQFKWGTTSLSLTSLSVSAGGVENEIDITSMSSKVTEDEEKPEQKYITKDTDTCYAGESNCEIQVEFFAEEFINNGNVLELVGKKRDLLLILPNNDGGQPTAAGYTVAQTAVLTQMALNASTGEFVRGSATFRLSGN